MDVELRETIKEFILKGIDEVPVRKNPDVFWQNLRKTGTEIWLDTGDIEEASRIWTVEMTALTTNNTLISNEIKKGIYDEYIARAKEIVKHLPVHDQVLEIAFILNARHGLRLAQKFGGFVSVELHTNTAHDFDAIIDYGQRYFSICPDHFIIKVPYTATGLLGARKLKELGVRINFTLEFSARQNLMVAYITRPDYLNVFLGRLGAYLKDNDLGDGSGVGERTVLSTQKWINQLRNEDSIPTKLIAASLRSADQLETLAGVDVFTIPTKVADTGRKELQGEFNAKLDQVPLIELEPSAKVFYVEKLWEISDIEVELARDLADNVPANTKELILRTRDSGCRDLFPELSGEDLQIIESDGKIPQHEHWAKRIASGELAIDTLLNLAGLASFATDQKALDDRIKKIII